LPQLVNVFSGQMSLVGPRPLLSREISEYGIGFELYRCVRPGITGLWQISGRSETRFCDRVAFDEWYIKNWSIWYDIVILLKTAGALVRSRGAY
jgi:lipopolysaccharide/colanic/teichoic acid biosynthesis glycosyltransferase